MAWHPVNGEEFRVLHLSTPASQLREQTASRLVETDESAGRNLLKNQESTSRLVLYNHSQILIVNMLRRLNSTNQRKKSSDAHGKKLVVTTGTGVVLDENVVQELQQQHNTTDDDDEEGWAQDARGIFTEKTKELLSAAKTEYSPHSTHWMPHTTLRQLHAEWKWYFSKWYQLLSSSPSRNSFDNTSYTPLPQSASSLLSSFFCAILLDESQDEESSIEIHRLIVDECLEVCNDGFDAPSSSVENSGPSISYSASDAVPYYAFIRLVQTLSGVLFHPKHPYIAMHLMCVVLSDRVHRVH